jgi:hypothetical protein
MPVDLREDTNGAGYPKTDDASADQSGIAVTEIDQPVREGTGSLPLSNWNYLVTLIWAEACQQVVCLQVVSHCLNQERECAKKF